MIVIMIITAAHYISSTVHYISTLRRASDGPQTGLRLGITRENSEELGRTRENSGRASDPRGADAAASGLPNSAPQHKGPRIQIDSFHQLLNRSSTS